MPNLSLFLPFLVAFVVTTIATPLSIPFIKRFGLLDDPKTHKHPAIVHTKPTPRGGGFPLLLGIIVAGIFFLPFTKITFVLLITSIIAMLIGILDDKVGDFSRYIRFLANIFCAMLIVGSGISIP